jgi:S-adenosylmethionine:diacylglycerol 3-amino-3-carboxypropyl transferase
MLVSSFIGSRKSSIFGYRLPSLLIYNKICIFNDGEFNSIFRDYPDTKIINNKIIK